MGSPIRHGSRLLRIRRIRVRRQRNQRNKNRPGMTAGPEGFGNAGANGECRPRSGLPDLYRIKYPILIQVHQFFPYGGIAVRIQHFQQRLFRFVQRIQRCAPRDDELAGLLVRRLVDGVPNVVQGNLPAPLPALEYAAVTVAFCFGQHGPDILQCPGRGAGVGFGYPAVAALQGADFAERRFIRFSIQAFSGSDNALRQPVRQRMDHAAHLRRLQPQQIKTLEVTFRYEPRK